MDHAMTSQPVFAGFVREFGTEPAVVTRAPGRLEILGNHTDYNEGVVLSVAVDRETGVALSPIPGRVCELRDLRSGEQRRFSLDELDRPIPRDWANYIKGLIVELNRRGAQVPAFQGVLLSTLPPSAGMSSSAALEMAASLALGRIAGLDLPWLEWARIGQACENHYVGARTGLLDQFSSLRGKKENLVFSDFRDYTVQNIPLPAGTALVVANSMVKHHLANEYNERRSCCEAAVAGLRPVLPGIKALRDVSLAQLEAHRERLDTVAFRRARHVIGENERVMAGIAALKSGDIAAFGQLMHDSHESSRLDFENSCPELDILVETGRSLPGYYGARLSGGGFGGITVHLVAAAQAERYATLLAIGSKVRTGQHPETMICHAADGASVLFPRTE